MSLVHIPIGTRVQHPTHGEGVVLEPSRHTHPNFERVEFTVPTFVVGRPPRQVRLRVPRDLLTLLTPDA